MVKDRGRMVDGRCGKELSEVTLSALRSIRIAAEEFPARMHT